MKMKLAQRLLLKYYKTKIKTVGIVSPKIAAKIAFDLFCKPFQSKTTKKVPVVFFKAKPISLKLNGLTIRGFHWKPENANGKKILIAHGFSSCAYKFEKYVVALKKEGFEVVAFDAPAHGNSEGKRINAIVYRDMILKAEKIHGSFFGIIAHSLGGLSAALAFEQFKTPENKKLVLIAPATETKTAIKEFFKIIPSEPKIVAAFEEYIKELAQKPLSYFSVARVVKQLSKGVLWVHDEEDAICTFKDVAPLLTEAIPSVQFIITKGLGHNKIYKEQSIKAQIVAFLSEAV
jgi:pimeloyl-ACP methyl ester carboxylesterase